MNNRIAELVWTNEAWLIEDALGEGMSLSGAMMVIDRGRRRQAGELRAELGDAEFIAGLKELAAVFASRL